MTKAYQPGLFGPDLPDQCIYCALAIPALLTDAHRHDDPEHKRTFRLCWTCHFAYDRGILRHDEIIVAETAMRGGPRKIDLSAIHRGWERDLDSGARRIDLGLWDKRTPEQRSDAARRANVTRLEPRLHSILS